MSGSTASSHSGNPSAGQLDRRTFLRLSVGAALTMGLLSRLSYADSPARRVVILGIDAMDYGIVSRLMKEGRMPAFASMAREGTFLPLETSMPPLSPVAWTNLITGMNPGGHGVFDFLTRDPARAKEGLLPEDSVSKVVGGGEGAGWRIPLTQHVWPAQRKQTLLRSGVAFWDLLESEGVDVTVYRMPANFPVSESRARVLSGLGTPDIEGSYGTFSYFTERPDERKKDIAGGRVFPVVVREGQVRVDDNGVVVAPALYGPLNPFLSAGLPSEKRRTRREFQVFIDRTEKSAVIRIQDEDIVLRAGEWSRWVEARFDLLSGVRSVDGIVRFYLQEVSPFFRLYVSPVNLAPGFEGLATCRFDLHLKEKLGFFHTKGMSEETKALGADVFTPGEYIAQSETVLNEDLAALDLMLSESRAGMLFVYLSTLDLDSHALWKHQDPEHPAYDAKVSPQFADYIVNLYVKMDGVLARVRKWLGSQDTLYVVSDHGFVPFRREFNLMTWLQREGYLVYASPVKARLSKFYSDVDWSETRAYGVGFNGLFVNLKGREARGIVDPLQRDRLVAELRGKLLDIRDENGRPVFSNVYRPEDVYSGALVGSAPDLLLGYASGYGPSDQTVLGSWSEHEVADHVTGFSGHHYVDCKLVPGVLFTTRRLAANRARLEDVTVTILKEFGVPPAQAMTGQALY